MLNSLAKTAKLLSLLAAYCASSHLYAQTFTPIPTTGYNHDVIANGVGPAEAVTTNDVDGVSYVLRSIDWRLTATSTALSTGLPENGLITHPSNEHQSYQLQDYSANNSLRLNGTTASGTLELPNPSTYKSLSILTTSGSGESTFNAIVHFQDGSQATFENQNIPDWYDGSNPVHYGFGRVLRSTNGVENSLSNPRLYASNLTLACTDQTKTITKIDITRTTSGGSVVNVFALSGTPADAQIVGPSTLLLQQSTRLHAPIAGGSWSSDNPLIASVDALGNVQGIAAGQTTIKYVSPCQEEYSHSINIVEVDSPPTITLNSSSTTSVVGNAVTLTAIIEPSDRQGTVTFFQDANAVAECTASPIIDNQTVCTVSPSATGSYTYVASFNSNHPGIADSTSSTLSVDVLPAEFSVAASPSTADAASYGGSVVCTPDPIPTFGTTTCTATPEPNFMLSSWADDCSHTPVSSNTCALSNVIEDQTVSALFTEVQTHFSGITTPSAGTTAGTATVNFSGGGATCRVDSGNTAFVAAPQTLPTDQTMPHGMLQFKLIGCDTTPVTVSITWPEAVQGLTKWGMANSNATSPSHFEPSNLVVTGNTTTFTVQDGQLGDDDWSINGEILDPVGATVQTTNAAAAVPVPALGHFALILLSLIASACGALRLRKRKIAVCR